MPPPGLRLASATSPTPSPPGCAAPLPRRRGAALPGAATGPESGRRARAGRPGPQRAEPPGRTGTPPASPARWCLGVRRRPAAPRSRCCPVGSARSGRRWKADVDVAARRVIVLQRRRPHQLRPYLAIAQLVVHPSRHLVDVAPGGGTAAARLSSCRCSPPSVRGVASIPARHATRTGCRNRERPPKTDGISRSAGGRPSKSWGSGP
jgi:hypothetical protein